MLIANDVGLGTRSAGIVKRLRALTLKLLPLEVSVLCGVFFGISRWLIRSLA